MSSNIPPVSHKNEILSLVQDYRKRDPRFVDIIERIVTDLDKVILTVAPIQANFAALPPTGIPGPIFTFSVQFNPTAILLTWGTSAGAQLYELREGLLWESSVFILRTASLGAALPPRPAGVYHFLLKGISALGIEAVNAFPFDIHIPPMGTMTISAIVIDNNVLLSWTSPTSVFQITHFNVYRDGIAFAAISSNFLVRFEAASGTYLYEVEAVNIAGDVSARASVSAIVRQPPDYELQDSFISTFNGTKVNCIVDSGKLIACVDTVEQFQDHFISRSWADPEDQVTANYERFIQDNLLTGSYEETHDFGIIFNSIIVNLSYVKETFSGTGDVAVTTLMAVSDDGVTYSSFVAGVSQFFTSFRFLKLRLEFLAANDDSMIALSELSVVVNVKREVDSGQVLALETDPGGTVVFFNKVFKDVDSITLTVESETPITAIYDFVDAPNPVSFKVLAFDSSGNRVTYLVSWKARGIV